MSGLPAEMIDRWKDRPELPPDQGLIYWHVLLGSDPDVVALARQAQRRLAPFSGLHMTPLKWLHMTMLIAGPASEISGEQIEQMADAASRRLADVQPITVTLGKVLYHPEAIMLAARPTEALRPVLDAVAAATEEVISRPGQPGNKMPWTPHVTIAYSTASQPTAPIIGALGMRLPEQRVQISTISLVNQRGPERTWDWEPAADIRFGTGHPRGLH
jgi:2'-5' RNA ligase